MFHKEQIMGILNFTPDSFSDGGEHYSVEQAVEHAKVLIKDGADIIDIGGQSTRPGYQEVTPQEEIARIIPVIVRIREFSDVPISIDTYFAEVARATVQVGASIINDVHGMDGEGMTQVVSDLDVPVIIMHSRKRNVNLTLVEDLQSFYAEKIKECQRYGIKKENICFDPGIGFNKTMEENLYIMQHPDEFRFGDIPLLYGLSRKRIIGLLTDETNPLERDYGTIAASLFAMQKGVEINRVHNVKGLKSAWQVYSKLA